MFNARKVKSLQAQVDSLRNENSILRRDIKSLSKESDERYHKIQALKESIEKLESEKDAYVNQVHSLLEAADDTRVIINAISDFMVALQGSRQIAERLYLLLK